MSAPFRCFIAFVVLTTAGLVLITASTRDQRRAAIVHAQPALTVAAVRP